jgi:serine/threonine-protein kinase
VSKKAAPATSTDLSQDPLLGKRLGDYELTGVIATGGMARIYRGKDTRLHRQAAIKVLQPSEIEADKTLTRRFEREARAIAALEHDNIITIYQYNQQDGIYYLAMKLVNGKDLAQELKRLKKSGQKMDIRRALRILEQVAAALDYAHQAGVVHRDIKPSNILLDDQDKATLTDFGLVLRKSSETTMGTAFGTPRYIAPEQAISSNKALPQSDLYALAVIVYEILTGETPFGGDSPMEIALSHISDPPPPPRSLNPDIPAAAEREILRALEKEPEKRHPSAMDFIQALQRAYHISADSAATTAAALKDESPTFAHTTGHPGKAAMISPRLALPANLADRLPSIRALGRRRILLAVALLVVAALVVAALIGTAAPSNVILTYDENGFVMRNNAGFTLEVLPLQFIRGVDGEGRDDYTGDRVKGDNLPSDTCLWIGAQGSAALPCGPIHSQETLMEPKRFFWRQETPAGTAAPVFEVWYNRQVIARCDTVAQGQGTKECRFNLPAPTPEG